MAEFKEAAAVFDAAIKTKGLTQELAAREIGCSQSRVSHWANGTGRPEGHNRIIVEARFGVPAHLWLTESERQAVARATESGPLPTCDDTSEIKSA
jgi:transcriptional regulator with XRE-family HTH domain